MAVWICEDLSCWISSVSIYYAPKSDIRVKIYDHLNFLIASIVHFWVSRCIMGVNHTTESKVMTVGICQELSCSISSISIYYAPESDIRVKIFDLLNFSRASVVHLRVSQYIMGVKHTIESKVMAIWNCRDHSCSISRISIYYAPESDIRVKTYDLLNLLGASIAHFRASWLIMGLNHTTEWKVMTVWIFREHLLFNFVCLNISWASILQLSQKLRPFEFTESFRV